MKNLLLAAFVLLSVPAAHADEPAPVTCASIAYSTVTGASGFSVDQPSMIDAAHAARFMCGDRSCRPVITVSNECAAVAIGESGALGWANGFNAHDAEAKAIEQCHDLNSDCRVLRSVCTATHEKPAS